jgi:4-hydroxybenzoate polyprenyltransferase
VRGYVELLRPPNVTTALADVLAGYGAAGLGYPQRLGWLLGATACLYGGGVVLNDYFDRRLDAVERPERPIPSGRVRPSAAAAFGGVLLAVGVVFAHRATLEAAFVAAAIALLAVLYDGWSKHHALAGPVTMGACRGLNLLLGVAAVPPALAERWELAFLPFLYIWAVTVVSRGEVHGGRSSAAMFALAALTVVFVVLLALAIQSSAGRMAALVLTLLLAWRVGPPFWRAASDPRPAIIRRAVKTGVLSLVLLDAALSAVYAGTWYALIVLSAALLAGWLARQFAVT